MSINIARQVAAEATLKMVVIDSEPAVDVPVNVGHRWFPLQELGNRPAAHVARAAQIETAERGRMRHPYRSFVHHRVIGKQIHCDLVVSLHEPLLRMAGCTGSRRSCSPPSPPGAREEV